MVSRPVVMVSMDGLGSGMMGDNGVLMLIGW